MRGGGRSPGRGSVVGTRAALAALSLLFVAQGLAQAASDAPTVDEGPDLTAGLVAVERRDLRMNPEHGVLHHVLPGLLPALVADPILPASPAYDDGDWFDYTEDVLSANDRAGRLTDVLFWFRVLPVLSGVATAWVIFALGRRLGGEVGGLVAGGLWLTIPYVSGLAHLSSLDVSFSLAVTTFVLMLVRDAEQPTRRRATWVAVAAGAALLTRHSGIVLVPVGLAFVVVHRRGERRELAEAAALVLVAPVVLAWLVHRGIDPSPVGGPPRDRFDGMIGAARSMGVVERLVLAVPMPAEWRAGFAHLVLTSEARPAYLLGHQIVGNPPWFFPVSALVKVPLPAWGAVIAGWILTAVRRPAPLLAPLVAVAAVVSAFLLLQPLALGFRLAVPVLAVLVVGAASLGAVAHRPAVAVGLVSVCVLQIGATLAAHPASLAWTPWPFSDGYRAVSDSSIDFGQALFALRERHEAEPLVASTTIRPRGIPEPAGTIAVVGADAEDLVGRVAVSATALTVLHRRELSWLRAYCPVEVVQGAILVYEFAEPPDVRAGPATPAAPCSGEVSVRD